MGYAASYGLTEVLLEQKNVKNKYRGPRMAIVKKKLSVLSYPPSSPSKYGMFFTQKGKFL